MSTDVDSPAFAVFPYMHAGVANDLPAEAVNVYTFVLVQAGVSILDHIQAVSSASPATVQCAQEAGVSMLPSGTLLGSQAELSPGAVAELDTTPCHCWQWQRPLLHTDLMLLILWIFQQCVVQMRGLFEFSMVLPCT